MDRFPQVPGSEPGSEAERALSVSGGAAREDAARRFLGVTGHPALDRLAELAARIIGAPSAQVSILTDIQTIAAGTGAAGSSGETAPLAQSLCTVTASLNAPLVVSDAASDERVRTLPPVSAGQVGAYLGVPLADDAGRAVGALCVFDAAPRAWSEADLALLEQLAASVVAELQLSALSSEYERTRLRWELAIRAGGVGSWMWDLRTGELEWDDQLTTMFGYDDGSFRRSIDDFRSRLHPEDRPQVSAALDEAIATCGDYEAEYRVVLPDGTTRWVAARGRVMCGSDGVASRVLGAAYDTTSHREAESRVVRVLESMPAAFYSLDSEWRFRYVNAEAERLLGRSREELLGGVLWELFPATAGSAFEANYRAAVESGQPVTFDAYYPAPLEGWFELRAWPGSDGLSVYFLDVTARRAAQERAERAALRSQLLAEVTSELNRTLDTEVAVARLAQLVVPALADWCVVTLVDGEPERLRDVGSWHVDPAMRESVERYAGLRLAALTEESYVVRALRAGEPVLVPGDATASILEVLGHAEARDVLSRLRPAHAAVLPLRGRQSVVGAITLFSGGQRGPFAREDLVTAQDVASRAGLALNNARLYEQQRRLAEGLQRSLLTDPPQPDDLEIAVRYAPAADTAQVGGDWYDAFQQRQGATVVVIGDVVGHDAEAAAAMGQVRSLLRAIAFHSGASPAGVLSGLDEAMAGLGIGTTASAVVARLEQAPDEHDAGTTRLRWSNAGHPPPMVVAADGGVHVLTGGAPDLLLGIDPDARHSESVVVLDRGATVLLYTDGLVERRGQSLDEGLDRLREALDDLAGLPLEQLCDRLLERLLPERSEDDVALVAVRLHHQQRD